MLSNQSSFGAIEEKKLYRRPVCYCPKKMNSSFLRKEFRKDCRRLVEDFVSSILSTVAARSPVGRDLSCFCRKINIGGDDYSVFHLFWQLLVRLLELGWVRGSAVVPAKAELHSLGREQRQVEVSGSQPPVPINSVFAFCNQPEFLCWRKLHKVSIMVFRNHLGLLMILHVCCSQVFKLTELVVKFPSELHPFFTVSSNEVAIDHEKVNEVIACVQDSVGRLLFTQINFSPETGISMFNTAVVAADSDRYSSELDPGRAIRVEVGPVITDHKSCREKNVLRRKTIKDTRERWLCSKCVESSAVGEAARRTTVRISDVVEVGDVQYIEEPNKLGLPCCSRSLSSPGKNKKRRMPVSPLVAKNNFLLKVRLIVVVPLKLLSRRVLRSWCEKKMSRAAQCPSFPGGI